MAKQTYNERLKEVSRATVDAKIWGCGFLMLLPDGTYKHISHDDITVKDAPKRAAESELDVKTR